MELEFIDGLLFGLTAGMLLPFVIALAWIYWPHSDIAREEKP